MLVLQGGSRESNGGGAGRGQRPGSLHAGRETRGLSYLHERSGGRGHRGLGRRADSLSAGVSGRRSEDGFPSRTSLTRRLHRYLLRPQQR